MERKTKLFPADLDPVGTATTNHKMRFAKAGEGWPGIKMVRYQRTAKCFNCGREPIKSALLPECNTCRWIVCTCGACDCMRRLRSV